jgi:hypothetical protein
VTAQAVRQRLEHDGAKAHVLRTSGLLDDLTVTVSVANPHWDPTTPLLPDHAPARVDTTAVWS